MAMSLGRSFRRRWSSGDVTWDENKLCVLKVPNPRETGEAFLNVVTNELSALWMPWRDSPEVLAAIAGPGHGTRLIESLAFQGEKRLVMLDTANQLGSIELADPPESAGAPPMWKLFPGPAMDLGMIQDSTMSIMVPWMLWTSPQRKVFPSVRDTNLLVRNGSELIDINLDRRLICGRMSIGLAGCHPGLVTRKQAKRERIAPVDAQPDETAPPSFRRCHAHFRVSQLGAVTHRRHARPEIPCCGGPG